MRTFPIVVAAVLAAGAAGCSSDDDKTASPTPTPATTSAGATGSTAHEVHAKSGNSFSPKDLDLKVGDTVMVIDDDPDAPHNFVVAGVGRSETLGQGDQFSLTFAKAGTFEFVCTFHESQGMKGTITVS